MAELEHVEHSDRAGADAAARGAIPHLADVAGMSTKDEVLGGIARALSFPDYFGYNLDALYDCLRDLSWLPAGEHVLILTVPARLRDNDPKAYQGIERALADAAGERLTVLLADS